MGAGALVIVETPSHADELASAWRDYPVSGARHLVLAALGARRNARMDRSYGRTHAARQAARVAGRLWAAAFELDPCAATSMRDAAARNGW